MSKRPAIPADLRRRVLVEAGHRCAIPTCRHPSVEVAHIEPWSQVQKHEQHNLIALCPNCHTRYDRTKEIDRKAMRMYKAKLAFLSDRYTRYELRVMDYLRTHEGAVVNGEISIWSLLQDQLVQVDRIPQLYGSIPVLLYVKLTPAGHRLLEAWSSPESEGLTYDDPHSSTRTTDDP